MKARQRSLALGGMHWLLAILLLLAACTQAGPPEPMADAPELELADAQGRFMERVSTGRFFSCALRTDGTVDCWGGGDAQRNVPSGTFTQVSAGNFHACGLRSDGTIACWGDNDEGQTNAPSGTFTQVTAGGWFSCGLRQNGTAVCWGANDYGQTNVPTILGASLPFVQISAGQFHACGIGNAGGVVCWGNNGQNRATPPSGTFKQVSAGGYHSCGLRSNGTVTCWGSNDNGQRSAPSGTFSQVSAGQDHSCGVRTDGTLACWGKNESYRVSITVTTPPAGAFTQVAAGGEHTCAISPFGNIVCSGSNTSNQATPPAGSTTYSLPQVSATPIYTCIIKTDGTLACWGDDLQGWTSPPSGTFTQLSGNCAVRSDGTVACWGFQWGPPSNLGVVTQVATGGTGSVCAIRANGTLVCWGPNLHGETDAPSGTFVQLSAGHAHVCAIRDDGTLVCWGGIRPIGNVPAGTFTQLSSGYSQACAIRTNGTLACWGEGPTDAPSGTFVQVSAGRQHSCAIRTNGTLACWGNNDYGRTDAPIGTFTHLSASDYHTCAVKADGGVTCWGGNQYSQHVPGSVLPIENGVCTIAVSVGHYPTIQAAVNDANCTTLAIAPGTYHESVQIARDVIIEGAGAASTSVNSNGTGNRAFTITGGTVTLTNLTIQNSIANLKSTPFDLGGGIYNEGTLHLNGVVVSNNGATSISGDGRGGGIANRGIMTIHNSTIADNRSDRSGGGIFNDGGSLTIRNSTIANNTANYAGGISIWAGNVDLTNVTITGNRGRSDGAIYNHTGGSLTLSFVTVSDNFNNVAGYYGVIVNYGTATAANSIFANLRDGNCTALPISDAGGNLKWPASDPSCPGVHGDPKLGELADNGGPTQTRALQPGSVAIDAGTCTDVNGATVATDQRGIARPQPTGGSCDIGAYELEQVQQAQTITFDALDDKTYGDAPFTVSATASSGLLVSFAAEGACTVSGTTVTITGAGACTITASQAGNASYHPAEDVQRSFNIAKVTATLSLSNLAHTYDGSLKAATVTTDPPGLSGVTVLYDGSATAPTNPGSYEVVASLDNANYQAMDATGTLVINNPDNPTPSTSGISPVSATAGSNDVTLTVNGLGFVQSSVVRWNNQDLSTSYVSASQLSATVPANRLTTAATAEVTVHNPTPGGGSSNVQAFFITQAGTSVSNVDSASGNDPIAEIAGVVKAQATGTGTVAVAEYTDNPAGMVNFTSGGSYTDVYLASGHNFSEVVITLCGTGNLAYWWDISSLMWRLASNQRQEGGCVIVTVNSTTSPSLSQLHGTEFALGSKATPSFSDLSSPTIVYGDATTTLSGTITSTTIPTGHVSITLNGVTQEAAIGANGGFSSLFNTGLLNAGGYTISYGYAENDYFAAASDSSGSLTVERAAGSVSISNIPSSASFGGSFSPSYAKAGDGQASTASLTESTCTVTSGTVSFIGAGTCTLRASVGEGTNHMAATGADQSFTIGAASTTTTVSVTPTSQQYSDLVTLEATVESAAAGILTGTVQFKLGGVNIGSPQPLSNGSASLTNYQVIQAPDNYQVTAEFTSTNANFASSSSTAQTLTVTQEDARASYTGLEFVTTASARDSSASVQLSATVQDITAVDSSDADAGDIRNARVSFVNRDNGQTLCANLTPNLVSASDTKTGTVGCTVSLSAGSTSGTAYTVGIVVSGYYTRNHGDDNVTVMVVQPISGMITGGGHLVNTSSAGQYAGGNELKTNFGFNVKYNKNMTNLQGGVNIIIRTVDGKVYQIKANAMSSLSTNVNTGAASFVSKASLSDITDPLNPISVSGNLDLQMTMKDGGNPGTLDLIAITLRNSSGALLFSSSWNGTNAVEQNLSGGNLVVR